MISCIVATLFRFYLLRVGIYFIAMSIRRNVVPICVFRANSCWCIAMDSCCSRVVWFFFVASSKMFCLDFNYSAFGVALNPMASPRGLLFRVDSFPGGGIYSMLHRSGCSHCMLLRFQIIFRLHNFICLTPLYLVDFN